GYAANPALPSFPTRRSSDLGMFNALVMSYSRLPLAMAQDGMLPKFVGRLHPRTRAPWVAIIALAVGWAACLGLGFERLVTVDILDRKSTRLNSSHVKISYAV